MKKAICTTLAAAALAAAGLAQAQEVTLKFHHIWNTTAMASVNVITPWCDKIAKESANKLKCQVFPSMSMGGTPAQLVDQVKDGVADVVAAHPVGRSPELFQTVFVGFAEPAENLVMRHHP